MDQPITKQDVIAILIEALTKVSVEQPTGEWTEDINTNRDWDWRRFYCSNCGEWNTYGKSDYCPNCGARMKKGEQDAETGT